MVRKFEDGFPTNFLGVSLNYNIGFVIDSELSTKPISISPY